MFTSSQIEKIGVAVRHTYLMISKLSDQQILGKLGVRAKDGLTMVEIKQLKDEVLEDVKKGISVKTELNSDGSSTKRGLEGEIVQIKSLREKK